MLLRRVGWRAAAAPAASVAFATAATATAAINQYTVPSGGCGSLRLCGCAISRRSSVSTVSIV